ncbi:MAG: thioredoxin family protein [Salibacteraceae bacterium]
MNYQDKWNDGQTFSEYLELVEDLIEKGKSTGPIQSEDLLNYSKLNAHRMQRILKTFEPSDSSMDVKAPSTFKYLIIITEGWCGDAAQIVPVAVKFFESIGVQVRCILRDEHTDLIDAHLTNGARSIPILVFLNKDFEVVKTWGPRPAPVQEMVMAYKAKEEPKPPYSSFSKEVQLWYSKDKQRHMIEEWSNL